MTTIEREAELDRRFENLKAALREYVDFIESSKKDEAPAPRKRKHCKGSADNT